MSQLSEVLPVLSFYIILFTYDITLKIKIDRTINHLSNTSSNSLPPKHH